MTPSKCPSCGGEELRVGGFRRRVKEWGLRFYPEGYRVPFFSWSGRGLEPKGFVCLECGYLGLFLDEESRRQIK